MLSTVDYFMTMFVIVIFFIVNKKKILQLDAVFRTKYLDFVCKFYFVFVLLVVYLVYGTYKNLSLVILNGYNREGLLNSVSAGYLDMLLPNLFNCLFVVSVLYKYPIKIRLIFFLGVISIMLFYLSRSNLIFLIYFPLVFLFIINRCFNYKIVLKFFLVVFLVVLIASGITVVQGRGENIQEVLFKIFETLFRYKAYSFYLAEYAIEISHGVEKSLFPFLGWFSEKIVSMGWAVDNPIAIYNSEFVFEFRFLGNGYRANVLYPWWSWFYGYYGILGLFLKSFFSYFILAVTLRFRLSLTFMYLLYTFLFIIVVKHPLINASAFYSIFVLLIFDLLIKVKYDKTAKR